MQQNANDQAAAPAAETTALDAPPQITIERPDVTDMIEGTTSEVHDAVTETLPSATAPAGIVAEA